MMQLKITTPNKVIYNGEVSSVLIPTESGSEKIVAHQTKALVAAIKPGLIRISTNQTFSHNDYIISNNDIYISIDKGMAFVDGTTIRIVSSQATTIPNQSIEHLEKSKDEIEKQLKILKKEGSVEQIEKYMTKLQKINADISLEEIKNQ